MPTSDFEPRRILCPVDFSGPSSLALKYAAVGAREYKAELYVLHAHAFELPPYFGPGQAPELIRELASAKAGAKDHLAASVKEVLGGSADRLSVRYEVSDAYPLDAILDMVEKGGMDLIVLGSSGRSGVKRVLLGSVAEKVMRSSVVPVFLVRQKEYDFIDVDHAEAEPRLERILCPVNFMEQGKAGIRIAASLAERFHALLTVLHVMEQDSGMDESAARDRLCAWISDTTNARCSLEPLVRKGYPAEQIIARAREGKEDLTVVCAHHRRFHEDTFFGRTTDLVVRHAPTPVLMIPLFPETAQV